jgi:hypothetical protein
VARHCLREEQAAFDVGAKLADDGGEVGVLGLLLQDDQRADDVQAGLDHRRELAREDLERLRLDLLEDGADALLTARGELFEALCEQAADTQLLPSRFGVGRVDLAAELQAFRIDGAISKGRHVQPGIGSRNGGLEEPPPCR